jgi:predicted TPR repeat methyltransferase
MRGRFSSPINYYDWGADNYDEVFYLCKGDNRIIFSMIQSHFPGKMNGKLLDIGCGTGLSSAPFAQCGIKISGIDAAAGMLKVFAAKGFAESACQVNVENKDFPFASGHFDLAISNGVFCFLPKLDKVIGEAGRVLKPGGIFCFTVEDISRIRPPRIVRSNMDIYRHGYDELAAILKKSGFDLPLYHNCIDHQMLIERKKVIFTAMLCRKM